jgi:hypothetical protein
MEGLTTAIQIAEWKPHGKSRRGRLVNAWNNGIGPECKEDTSRMKNVSIEGSGEGKMRRK